MTYVVTLTESVKIEIERVDPTPLRYWTACLEEIARNPFERHGVWVDHRIPIASVPSRTYIFEIREEVSISGERLFVFFAEFFPEYAPVYVIDDDRREAVVFYLRPTP